MTIRHLRVQPLLLGKHTHTTQQQQQQTKYTSVSLTRLKPNPSNFRNHSRSYRLSSSPAANKSTSWKDEHAKILNGNASQNRINSPCEAG